MKIEIMNASHVAQIAALEKICFADPWSEKSIASELDNKLAFWLVAAEGEQVDETDMMNVAVHPDFRRKGVAESLIEELVDHLRRMGSHCLTLEVRASNAPAIALYEKLNFREIGRRKNYYRNPKEDALILRKEWEI